MNKTDSYLDKTKYYLAQLEIDFDVRLQQVQGEVEAFKVTLWLVVMEGEMRAICTGFYPTAELAPLICYLQKLYLTKPIKIYVLSKGIADKFVLIFHLILKQHRPLRQNKKIQPL